MKKVVLILVAMLATSAFGADFSFAATYDFSKDSPCTSPTQTLCIQDIIIIDLLTGVRRVDATMPAPATANSPTSLTSPVVTIKNLYGDVVFYGVARGRDAAGNLVESTPTPAPSVTAKPGAVVSVAVTLH